MAKYLLTVIIVSISLAGAAVAADAPAPLTGRVVAVQDGDTITLLDSSMAQHRVRLNGIDAPEKGQPGAQRSKESLSALVYEQPIRVDWQGRDTYGRVIGKVWVASPDSPCRGRADCPMTLDAGLAQIAMGRAWWFRAYADGLSPEDRVRYESAEADARRRKAGLWRSGVAVAPWDWRAARPR